MDVTDLSAVSIYLGSKNFGVALHAHLTFRKYCSSLSRWRALAISSLLSHDRSVTKNLRSEISTTASWEYFGIVLKRWSTSTRLKWKEALIKWSCRDFCMQNVCCFFLLKDIHLLVVGFETTRQTWLVAVIYCVHRYDHCVCFVNGRSLKNRACRVFIFFYF